MATAASMYVEKRSTLSAPLTAKAKAPTSAWVGRGWVSRGWVGGGGGVSALRADGALSGGPLTNPDPNPNPDRDPDRDRDRDPDPDPDPNPNPNPNPKQVLASASSLYVATYNSAWSCDELPCDGEP